MRIFRSSIADFSAPILINCISYTYKRDRIICNHIAKNPQHHCGFFRLLYNSLTLLKLQAEQIFKH